MARWAAWDVVAVATGKVLGSHERPDEAEAFAMAMRASRAAARRVELSADQLAPICPSCADRMRRDNIRGVYFHVGPVKIYGVEVGTPLGRARYFAVGPNADALCEKFGGDEGFFTRCAEHMAGQEGIEDPKGFCAELHKHCVGKYPAEKRAASAARARGYGLRARGAEWDLVREPDGTWVGTYASEADARAAQDRLAARATS